MRGSRQTRRAPTAQVQAPVSIAPRATNVRICRITRSASFEEATFSRPARFDLAHVLNLDHPVLKQSGDMARRVWPKGWTVRTNADDPTHSTLVHEPPASLRAVTAHPLLVVVLECVPDPAQRLGRRQVAVERQPAHSADQRSSSAHPWRAGSRSGKVVDTAPPRASRPSGSRPNAQEPGAASRVRRPRYWHTSGTPANGNSS